VILVTEHGHGTAEVPSAAPLALEDGYRLQRQWVDQRLAEGDRQAGWKLGFTSQEAMGRLGLAEPVAGVVWGGAVLASGATLRRAEFATLRMEAEVALILARDIDAALPESALVGAIGAAHAAVEVVDSGPVPPRGVGEIVAGNIAFARAVIGDPIPGGVESLEDLPASVMVDGEWRGTGSGREAYGGPLAALAWLVRFLSARGAVLRAGDIVLTGALLPAVPVDSGVCEVIVGDAARVVVRVV
jgi:2-keto-4-pentenoate hydratase